MALFGSSRDASLIRAINKELINNFIDVEVAWYKLSLQDTQSNMYDEADNKTYYAPMRINCLAQKDEKTIMTHIQKWSFTPPPSSQFCYKQE